MRGRCGFEGVADASAVEASKRLWRLSFPDEGRFTDFYFERRCVPGVIMACHEEEGEVVSAFQFFPYSLNYGGVRTAMRYVSGACTHPLWRGKRMMGKCFLPYFRMVRNESPFAMLIPATKSLFDFYYKYGFAVASHRRWTVFEQDANGVSGDVDGRLTFSVFPYKGDAKDCGVAGVPSCEMSTSWKKCVINFFVSFFEKETDCVLHTFEDVESVLDAYSDGRLYLVVLHEEGAIRSAAVCGMQENETLVHEVASVDDACRRELLVRLQLMRKGMPVRLAEYIGEPFSMVRILNVENALRMYHGFGGEVGIIKVKDDFMPENGGFYRVADGFCEKVDSDCGGTCYGEYTINELAQLLFRGRSLRMSLMLDY